MSSSITINGAFNITAIAGKSGKVSKGATNAVNLLNGMTQAGIIGAALSSTGAIGNTARAAIASHIVTLESLLNTDLLDGGQWGNLLGLAVGRFGVATFNAATMRGKLGVHDYMTVTRNAAVLSFDLADTAKAQDRAKKSIEAIDTVAADVDRLIAAANAASDNFKAAQLLLDAGLSDATANAPEAATAA
jgi:hypothetical protein